MRLLLLGCTGFVGRELVPQLIQSGHQLTIVSRRLPRGYEAERSDGRMAWLQLDPAQPASWQEPSLKDALTQADGVVNLAGEPIAEQRWTAAHLKVLENSRLDTTRLLVESMAALPAPPKVLVSASAIGFTAPVPTPASGVSAAGSDFLASLCERWEAAAAAVPHNPSGDCADRHRDRGRWWCPRQDAAGVPRRLQWADRFRPAMDELDPSR